MVSERGRIVYLVCPYSDPDRAVRVLRFEAANRAAGMLMRRGLNVFSPISHTHPIAEACDLPLGFDFWEKYDRAFIEHSSEVYVLKVAGWVASIGVRREIAIATSLGIPVLWLEPELESEPKP